MSNMSKRTLREESKGWLSMSLHFYFKFVIIAFLKNPIII